MSMCVCPFPFPGVITSAEKTELQTINYIKNQTTMAILRNRIPEVLDHLVVLTMSANGMASNYKNFLMSLMIP